MVDNLIIGFIHRIIFKEWIFITFIYIIFSNFTIKYWIYQQSTVLYVLIQYSNQSSFFVSILKQLLYKTIRGKKITKTRFVLLLNVDNWLLNIGRIKLWTIKQYKMASIEVIKSQKPS